MSGVVVNGFIFGKIAEAESCAFGGALVIAFDNSYFRQICSPKPAGGDFWEASFPLPMTRGKTFGRIWNPFPCNPNSGGYGVDRLQDLMRA